MQEIDVLLIEADPMLSVDFKCIISQIGGYHEFYVAEDAEEGQTYLDKVMLGKYRLPELIVIDSNCGPDGGLALLKRLKDNDVFRCKPVIMLAQPGQQALADEAYLMNANCCVIKDAEPSNLHRQMADVWNYWLSTSRLYCSELMMYP